MLDKEKCILLWELRVLYLLNLIRAHSKQHPYKIVENQNSESNCDHTCLTSSHEQQLMSNLCCKSETTINQLHDLIKPELFTRNNITHDRSLWLLGRTSTKNLHINCSKARTGCKAAPLNLCRCILNMRHVRAIRLSSLKLIIGCGGGAGLPQIANYCADNWTSSEYSLDTLGYQRNHI